MFNGEGRAASSCSSDSAWLQFNQKSPVTATVSSHLLASVRMKQPLIPLTFFSKFRESPSQMLMSHPGRESPLIRTSYLPAPSAVVLLHSVDADAKTRMASLMPVRDMRRIHLQVSQDGPPPSRRLLTLLYRSCSAPAWRTYHQRGAALFSQSAKSHTNQKYEFETDEPKTNRSTFTFT